MPKFRKKPIVIEAMQWDGTTKSGDEIIVWSDHLVQWLAGWDARLVVATMEGVMEVAPKDWIIRGVKGEFYPCKPDIFDETYIIEANDALV